MTTPIIILGIAGSLRRESYSRAILTTLQESVIDATILIHGLGDLPLFNADLEGEHYPKSSQDLKDAIIRADGLLIVTPEYNYGIPGVLKNAIDWVSRPGYDSCLKNKPVAIVSSSAGAIGGVRAQAQLKTVLLATLSRVFPWPEVAIGNVSKKIEGGKLTNLEALSLASTLLHAFSRDLAAIKNS
ncbi:NADPH-dependent FMN reductase [Aminobacter sp. MSH1]|uniref:NADPH-dependent FMN reductase n=1 Tax=Aminobacter sp. MSH1 TaxID=374606 RepID=UPI000D34F87C|nr:NADPH-dependent FMN reductase [Aminobacter sp. MSH1]